MSDVLDRIEAADQPDPETWCGTAVVTNAAAGTTADGRLLITVNWRGTSITCGFLVSYTPLVGHNVTFLKAGSSFFVLGRAATAN